MTHYTASPATSATSSSSFDIGPNTTASRGKDCSSHAQRCPSSRMTKQHRERSSTGLRGIVRAVTGRGRLGVARGELKASRGGYHISVDVIVSFRPLSQCVIPRKRTGYKGVGAVSGSPPASVSQVNSAPGSFLPFFAPKRDIIKQNNGFFSRQARTQCQFKRCCDDRREKKFRRSSVTAFQT